jgi:hypothetical protein
MRSYFPRFAVAVLAVAALGAALPAQDIDRVVVNIPYDFVVAGKTLPAGAYRVERNADYDQKQLIIRGLDNNTAVLTVSNTVANAADRPGVTFLQAGEQHFLSRIETGQHVFTIAVRDADVQQALNNPQRGYLTGTTETNKR